MRLLQYEDVDGRHMGALHDGQVVRLHALSEAHGLLLPDTIIDLIDAGDEGLRHVRHALDGDVGPFLKGITEVRIVAPLQPRENVMAIGRNYAEHADEMARAAGTGAGKPTFFTKAVSSIVGPYDDIPAHADITQQLDWEAELGVVIGKGGRDIGEADALDHVWGYTVLNDVSARDIQYGWGGQFFKGKSLDGTCPIGPYIVTADEVEDPQNVQVQLRVNGETKQDASTSTMIHRVAGIVSLLSLGMTLQPGNLIATGTPSGVGHGRTPPEYLKAGDVMETEISGIGILRNRIV